MSQPEELAIQGHFYLTSRGSNLYPDGRVQQIIPERKTFTRVRARVRTELAIRPNFGRKKTPGFLRGFLGKRGLLGFHFRPALHFLKVGRRRVVDIFVHATIFEPLKLGLYRFHGLDKLVKFVLLRE